MTSVLTAVTHRLEAEFVRVLEAAPDVTLVRRCADVAELLSAGAAGVARVAVVSPDLRGLDRDALRHLAGHGLRVAGLVDPDDEEGERRLRQLGDVGTAPHEGDVGGRLEHLHELGLAAVGDRGEDARHGPAAGTPPGTGTRVMRAPRSTSATNHARPRAAPSRAPPWSRRSAPSTPSSPATRTTDTASSTRSGPAYVGSPTVVPSFGRLT